MTCEHEYHWYASPCDEAGWRCAFCEHKPGEPAGYSPQLDRELIGRKVYGVLTTMADADIVYVSNGSEADHMVAMVARLCVDTATYDSETIARMLIEIRANDAHAKFWRDRGESILAGKDNRNRCHCGALATWTRVGGPGKSEHGCGKHLGSILDDISASPPVLS
jgi:hypothetical protein